MRKILLISSIFLLVAVLGIASIGSVRPPSYAQLPSSTDSPVIGSYEPGQYGLPDFIAGYKVLAVLTSDNTACLETNTKRLVLQTTDPNVENFLSHSHPEAISQALEQLGLTKSALWDWEVVSADISSQEVMEHIQRWNQDMAQAGNCVHSLPAPEP